MTSRAQRRKQAKDAAKGMSQGAAVRETSTGLFELDIRGLPVPDGAFYANTAAVHVRGADAAFLFGQLSPGSRVAVQSAIGIDIPRRSIHSIIGTFDQKFRDHVRALEVPELEKYPEDALPANAITYPVHVARLMVNNLLAVLDFYEMIPTVNSRPIVNAAIRIKATPAVLRFFVARCDELAVGEVGL